MGLRSALASLIGVEDRADGDYTDRILIQEHGRALRGSDADLVTACTNAARITALTMARGSLELDGPLADYWRPALTRDWIYQAAYDALMYGDAVYLVDAADMAAGMLDRSGSFEVHGKRRPYRYRLEVMHPDGQETRAVSEAEVLHLRIGAEKGTPWRGRSVFADVLLRCIEKGLIDGARFPVQRVVNYPRSQGASVMDVGSEGARKMADDAWHSKLSRSGLLNLVDNSTHRGTAEAIKTADMAFRPDPGAVELRRDLVMDCYAAVGYPPALLKGDTPGQTVRQEFTRWIVGALQPVADILAGHIAAALEVSVTWNMDPARIPLPLDQSTVFRNLAREGVDMEKALEIAGLGSDG